MSYEYKPSTMLTNEELREQLKRLKAEVKAERKARGVPPEPPEDFVSMAMGWTLFKKCEPLIKYAKDYAKLCRDSISLIEIRDEHMAWIRSYDNYITLLGRVKKEGSSIYAGGAGLGVCLLYTVLTKHREYESVNLILRHLVDALQFTNIRCNSQHSREITLHDYASFWELGQKQGREKEQAAYQEIAEEVERLKDEEYFEAEFQKILEHYESIKHLY